MPDPTSHAARVDAWLKRASKGLGTGALLGLFEAALGALWVRSSTTLGEVTLTAIAERVLHDAAARFPLLAALRVDPAVGIECRGLRDRLGAVRPAELKEALRFVLIEFLTVLGNLTAEILTPELHAELGNVARPDPAEDQAS